MPISFPSQSTLNQALAPQSSLNLCKVEPKTSRDNFLAWSTVDDVKDKASQLTSEAAKEYEAASKKAQSKAGKIELYSPKYYAACTFGGLLACVSHP